MFEKEAEEEVNKEHWNYSTFKKLAQEYWQKGAEFGYNKANEWHYVKDELPKEEKDYIVKLTDGTVDIMAIALDGDLEPYLLTSKFDFYKDVEKWCEIPKE